MKQVMIVEDQKMIRSMLESYIEKEPGYQVAVSIAGANQAPGLCDTMGIDLILMDVQTEHRENGLSAVEKIKARHPAAKIVVVTSLLDHEVLARAKTAGADSLWYKDCTQEALMDVVRKTAAGAHIFPELSTRRRNRHCKEHGLYQGRAESAKVFGPRPFLRKDRRGHGGRGDHSEIPCHQYASKDQSGE